MSNETNSTVLYAIGDEHRSRYVDGKWGIDGSTPSIMAAFTRLCGKHGASEAKLRAHCASVGNKGFFAYALRNGWLVRLGDEPTAKTPAQRAATRDGKVSKGKVSKGKQVADADATKGKGKRSARKPKQQPSDGEQATIDAVVEATGIDASDVTPLDNGAGFIVGEVPATA